MEFRATGAHAPARLIALAASACALALSAGAAAAADAPAGQWPAVGGSNLFQRYSGLNDINRANVAGLKIVWTRPGLEPSLLAEYPQLSASNTPTSYFRSTPIVVDGIVYASNAAGLVEAFDGATGKTIWTQQPFSKATADVAGSSARGVAMWRSGDDVRIISGRGSFLYATDAKTGKPVTSFGEQGRINLSEDGRRGGAAGAPLIIGDIIVLGRAGSGPGGAAGTGGRGDDSGDQVAGQPQVARAYDVRTGRKLWEFSPMPAVGDPARASWGPAAGLAGAMASYGLISADAELGYVYIPFSAPNPPGAGQTRPGNNLYGDSVVAPDARTGKKVWHYQTIHHDVWDWDLASPPVLGDVRVNGKVVKALMVTGKLPQLFALDRVTGKPIHPTPERPVPKSTVPGEVMSPTQPMPAAGPYDRIAVSPNDLIDFTPELKREAQDMAKSYVFGPAYSPPTLCHDGPGGKGVLTLPGSDGGGNWNSGSYDPETNTYYTVAATLLTAWCLVKPKMPDATVAYNLDGSIQKMATMGPDGLPLIKPPYGRVVAIDMATGKIKWSAVNGEGPRNHPRLKHLNLPWLGTPGKAAIVATRELVFAGEGASTMLMAGPQRSYGDKFRAFDKRDGKVLAEVTLPAGTSGAPITYTAGGKQFVLVAVSGSPGQPDWKPHACPPEERACGLPPGPPPQWIALGL